jgi:hypothetical protein
MHRPASGFDLFAPPRERPVLPGWPSSHAGGVRPAVCKPDPLGFFRWYFRRFFLVFRPGSVFSCIRSSADIHCGFSSLIPYVPAGPMVAPSRRTGAEGLGASRDQLPVACPFERAAARRFSVLASASADCAAQERC